MRKLITGLLVVGFCGLWVTPVMAADSGWYGEVDIGQSTYNKSALNEQIPVFPPGWTGKVDNSAAAYKLLAIYGFNRYMAIEGGYVKLGQATVESIYSGSIVPIDTGTYKKDEIDTAGWQIAGIASYPFTDRWSVFGQFGLIDAKLDYSFQSNGLIIPVGHQSDTSWNTTYGIGVGRSFGDNWHLGLTWEEYPDLGKKYVTGEYNIGLISLGLQYRF